MLLSIWLNSLRAGLLFRQPGLKNKAKRNRKRQMWPSMAATLEDLEPRTLLSWNAVAIDDSYAIVQNATTTQFDVLANDANPDNVPLIITAATSPAHGIASFSGGSVSYSPSTGYLGQDTFSYTIGDGAGDASTAQVTVTVTQAPPTVTGISPNSGPAAGGTSLTITGTGFTNVTAISFGDTPAAYYMVMSPTSIYVGVPAHLSGAVDVTVSTSAGTSGVNPMYDQYTYSASPPTVTGISPNSGPGAGGTNLTITGTGFTNVTAVSFGDTAVMYYTVLSPTSISAMVPAHASGAVDVIVSTSAGTSGTNLMYDQYTYSASAPTAAIPGFAGNC